MRSQDFGQACAKFEESQRLSPAQGTLLNLALCREALGRVAQAEADLRTFLAAAPPDDPRRPIAEEHLRAVLARAARLTVKLQGPPGTAEVQVDGARIPPERIGVPLVLDPGTHRVSIAAAGGQAREASLSLEGVELTLREGETATHVLGLAAKTSRSPLLDLPGAPAPATRTPTWTYLAAGAGLAGLAVGLLTGGLAWREKGTMDEHCAADGCDGDGLSAARAGGRLSLVATLSSSVGILACGAAAVGWLAARPPHRGSRPIDETGVAGK